MGEQMDDALLIEIQRLCRVVHERGLRELSITRSDFSISLTAVQAGSFTIVPAHPPVQGTVPLAAGEFPEEPGGYVITAPLIGTFYRSPSPGAPPFIEVGDQVEMGQIIGIVEAMKVFNEITTDRAGTVIAIPVKDGQLVHVDQPLVILDVLDF